MNRDWRDLFQALRDAEARFLIVGAHALAVHGIPRGTQDLDLWIDASPENARRVWTALLAFGAPLQPLGITLEDLQKPQLVIQLGLPPNRVDLLTAITGVPSFDEAWRDRVEHKMEGALVPFLGRTALVQNKRATGRRKDLGDLEALGELPPGREG